MKNNSLNSLLRGFIIAFIFLYATIGITRLFWNTNDYHQLEGRAKFLGISLFIINVVLIIVPYHFLSHKSVEILYWCIIGFNMLYILVGGVYQLLFGE